MLSSSRAAASPATSTRPGDSTAAADDSATSARASTTEAEGSCVVSEVLGAWPDAPRTRVGIPAAWPGRSGAGEGAGAVWARPSVICAAPGAWEGVPGAGASGVGAEGRGTGAMGPGLRACGLVALSRISGSPVPIGALRAEPAALMPRLGVRPAGLRGWLDLRGSRLCLRVLHSRSDRSQGRGRSHGSGCGAPLAGGLGPLSRRAIPSPVEETESAVNAVLPVPHMGTRSAPCGSSGAYAPRATLLRDGDEKSHRAHQATGVLPSSAVRAKAMMCSRIAAIDSGLFTSAPSNAAS